MASTLLVAPGKRAKQLSTLARVVGRIYYERAGWWYWGRIRGDELARLSLPEGRRDPYPIYEELRARGPMVPTPLANWSTTNHTLANEVLRGRSFGVRPEEGEDPRRVADMLDLSLLELNPPDHTRIRRLAAPAFSPRRMAVYGEMVERITQDLLDKCLARGTFDLAAEFAAPLPIRVITELLGVPDADAAAFRRYGAIIGGALDGVRSIAHLRRLMVAQRELMGLFANLYELRRREPVDDIISALVAEEDQALSPAELSALSRLLLIAGFETTVNAIGNGVIALQRNPEQWRMLVENPALAPQAAEEVLRFVTPVHMTARVAFHDSEVGGVSVRKNQLVIVCLAAANRDPEVYPHPDRFDITRTSTVEHVAFSGGIHYCLGAPLARLELTTALRAMAERAPTLRLAGPVVMRKTTTIRGPQTLPVSV